MSYRTHEFDFGPHEILDFVRVVLAHNLQRIQLTGFPVLKVVRRCERRALTGILPYRRVLYYRRLGVRECEQTLGVPVVSGSLQAGN